MQQIFDELSKIQPLSVELKSFLKNNAEPFEYKKDKIIEKQAAICDHLYFIESGIILGQWSPDEQTPLRNKWILVPNQIATCYHSFFYREESNELLRTGSRVKGWRLSWDNFQKACEYPEWVNIAEQLRLKYRELAETFGEYAANKDAYKFFKLLDEKHSDILRLANVVQLASFMNVNRDTFYDARTQYWQDNAKAAITKPTKRTSTSKS